METGAGTTPVCLGSAVEAGPRTMRALAMVGRVLEQAEVEREQVDCLAVGIGPGSYTGIRAAISLAQGWQLARGIQLLGIRSVECLAWQAQAQDLRGRVNIAIDAQREEVYLATFLLGPEQCELLEPLHLAGVGELKRRAAEGQIVLGPEADRWAAGARRVFPEAAMLGRLAAGATEFVAGDKLEPVYLREAHFVKAPPPRIL